MTIIIKLFYNYIYFSINIQYIFDVIVSKYMFYIL